MRATEFAKAITACTSALVISACAPDLGARPQPAVLGSYAAEQSLAAPAAPWPTEQWWTTYGDPQLDGLIAEALDNAPDLKIAQARMKRAQAVAQQQGASVLPSLSVDGTIQRAKQSINIGYPEAFKSLLPGGWHSQAQLSAALEYEIDFLGKNRAALAASVSEAAAAEVDEHAAKLILSTAVASAYADLVRLNADKQTAADAVRVRRQSEDLVAQRVKQNLENEGTLAQARAATGIAVANADAVDGAIILIRNQIAALMGKGPDRGLAITPPSQAHLAPAGLPSSLLVDLIGRRPDIVSARLRAEAASNRIDVAHADFYPNVKLTVMGGFQSFNVVDLFKGGSGFAQIGPALHLPIFDGGRIEGAYRGARADYDEAVANYDKALTGALHEVADAMANKRELTSELIHSREALDAGETAYRIAKIRYQAGLSRYLDVLIAEDSVLELRRRVADLEAKAFSQDVALVRALGGGFSMSTGANHG